MTGIEDFTGEKSTLGPSCISLRSTSVSACSRLIAQRYLGDSNQILWVVPERDLVETRRRELEGLVGMDVISAHSYDHHAFLPFVPSRYNVSKRIGIFDKLTDGNLALVVAPPSFLVERFVPGDILKAFSELVMVGEEVERQGLLDWLLDTGYERVARVVLPGHFSVRGEIVDIFSPGFDYPVRILFFDELVEEIRLFNPESQRTVKKIDEAVLLPASEVILSGNLVEKAKKAIVSTASEAGWSGSQVTEVIHSLEQKRQTESGLSHMPFLYKRLWSIFDYLQDMATVVLESPLSISAYLLEYMGQMEEAYLNQINRGRLLPALSSFKVDFDELSCALREKRRIFINPPSLAVHGGRGQCEGLFDTGCSNINVQARRIEPGLFAVRRGGSKELFAPFFNRLDKWLEQGMKVVITAESDSGMERLTALFHHYHKGFNLLNPPLSSSFDLPENEADGPGVFLIRGFLAEAFEYGYEKAVFIPEALLFKSPVASRAGQKKKKKTKEPVTLSQISTGDLVVHRDKGIGRYLGLVRMKAAGVDSEFVHLEYHGGDKLYVPVDRLGLLQKYVGLDGRQVRLDKLGGRSWIARKSKVKKAIKEVAHELVELYALRKIKKGIAFGEPDEMYRQFEAAFPFEETEDQLQAIMEIIADLQADYPMDRLLCGDVGFGKTEVAMRAAFLAVESGYQVAVLVPTTLLSEQHERTFRERFRNFPVSVAGISRMKSKAEQRSILSMTRRGEIDILIGTHRLIQGDVTFRKLGLIIVDEEHRFGVKHKEKLKLLARDVNCLSLTATPIPRTLQLSLLGIRDLSTLETPPVGRIGIKTFLAEYDDSIVKEAITREIERGGQVFFVHNRVRGIYQVAEHISSLVKEARVDVAHGQMDAPELEEKMIRFVRGDINCLVCTTIIESGLDIPSANTLIVNGAHRLGIADLYQLRGRVGRSSRQAYAYLLVPNLQVLGKDASLRIKAIMETGDLGGGMNLAMHDLKIRGAGNLLGVAQAGQISEVGYDLYLDLLKEAIEDLKGNKVEERIEPEVNLGVSALIPEEYLPDISARMELYRRFSQIGSAEELEDVKAELIDQFGSVPQEVENLLEIMVIKSLLRRLNCVRLDGVRRQGLKITLSFGSSGPVNPDRLLAMVQRDGRLSLMPGDRLSVRVSKRDLGPEEAICKTKTVLKELLKLTN